MAARRATAAAALLLLAVLGCHAAAASRLSSMLSSIWSRPAAQRQRHSAGRPAAGGDEDTDVISVPRATHVGFLSVNAQKKSEMFYMYYEAQEKPADPSTTPIVLWLQGGPGCSSLFGMLYINGPYFINPCPPDESDCELTLRANKGSWNRLYGMLFIEQPLGVGWSRTGSAKIPDNELDVAWDLYRALQSFYGAHPAYAARPLIVTGESYAGKYAPSIAHFVLQAEATAGGYLHRVKHARELGPGRVLDAPLFRLGGLAVGNGFTDAETQTAVQAEVAFNMGLIDLAQRRAAEEMQVKVIDMVRAKEWRAARTLADELMAFITNASASASLEDVRRNTGYDGQNGTDRFLNLPHVKAAINAPADVFWVGCSPEVDKVLGHDVMKSVKNLVVDLLDFVPVLLYQGQFDAECGVASNDAWISTMKWSGHLEWQSTNRAVINVNDRPAFYWKALKRLSHVVIRNTGHMVPHDNPLYGQLFLEKWVEESVLGRPYDRPVTPAMERDMANPDQGDQSI